MKREFKSPAPLPDSWFAQMSLSEEEIAKARAIEKKQHDFLEFINSKQDYVPYNELPPNLSAEEKVAHDKQFQIIVQEFNEKQKTQDLLASQPV